MSNEHFIKIFCPTTGKEGIINDQNLPKTCPFCGCVIIQKDIFWGCSLQFSPASA